MWVRVTSDGNDVTVYCATTKAGLDTASACFTSGNFTLGGGYIGFGEGDVDVDDFELVSDSDADGDFDAPTGRSFGAATTPSSTSTRSPSAAMTSKRPSPTTRPAT